MIRRHIVILNAAYPHACARAQLAASDSVMAFVLNTPPLNVPREIAVDVVKGVLGVTRAAARAAYDALRPPVAVGAPAPQRGVKRGASPVPALEVAPNRRRGLRGLSCQQLRSSYQSLPDRPASVSAARTASDSLRPSRVRAGSACSDAATNRALTT